jgi:MATE family multidrug resistance protein
MNSGKTAMTHRAVLAVAAPIIISNLSTPLLGLVDTAVMGRIDDARYIGAIALGAMMFNMLFWAFGFLRMGTTGLSAQAAGGKDFDELRAVLGRAASIGLIIGLGLIAVQVPLAKAALQFLNASGEVETLADKYFSIRIWSAPAALVNYAILGWFIGIGRAGRALAIQLVLNGVNIVLDAYFVLGLGMDADGVALGTAIAEYCGLAMGVWLVYLALGRRRGRLDFQRLFAPRPLLQTLALSRDLMIRTLCLIFSFSWFTAQGATLGDDTLAANAVLRNFLTMSAFLLDGFAFAAETLIGQAVGAKDYVRFRSAVRISFQWTLAISICLAAATLLLGPYAIDFLTVNSKVRALSNAYLLWLAAAPLVGVFAYLLDGIFIGATRAADLRNMMIASTVCYLAAWYVLMPSFGNHGLWAALLVFFAVRGLTLAVRLPALIRARFR